MDLRIDDFIGHAIKRASKAAELLERKLAQYEATWDPHDWSDWGS